MTEEERKERVRTIIQNWFGEELESMENEDDVRRHLIKPLEELVSDKNFK